MLFIVRILQNFDQHNEIAKLKYTTALSQGEFELEYSCEIKNPHSKTYFCHVSLTQLILEQPDHFIMTSRISKTTVFCTPCIAFAQVFAVIYIKYYYKSEIFDLYTVADSV